MMQNAAPVFLCELFIRCGQWLLIEPLPPPQKSLVKGGAVSKEGFTLGGLGELSHPLKGIFGSSSL